MKKERNLEGGGGGGILKESLKMTSYCFSMKTLNKNFMSSTGNTYTI